MERVKSHLPVDIAVREETESGIGADRERGGEGERRGGRHACPFSVSRSVVDVVGWTANRVAWL